MTVYADASALLKLYVDEPDSDVALRFLTDQRVVTGRHAIVEVRRNLKRLLSRQFPRAREAFLTDLAKFVLVDIDERTCELAAVVAEQTGVRALDALHLGAAQRYGDPLTFVTFDNRQAQAARSLGFTVVGA